MKNAVQGAIRQTHRDARGAVLVEFLVACMPLMITFFSFVQLAQIAQARVVVKHATVVGARAAAVMSNTNHNLPDASGDKTDANIAQGVKLALGPWYQTMQSVDVVVTDHSNCDSDGVFDDVEVKVTVDYKCSVPFGGFVVCGAHGGVHHMVQTYAFPHQGARYKMDADSKTTQCGKGGGNSTIPFGGGGGGAFGGGGATGTWGDPGFKGFGGGQSGGAGASGNF